MSTHGIFRVPEPVNEPVRSYAPGHARARGAAAAAAASSSRSSSSIPLVIGGEEVRTGDTFDAVEPHDRSHVLATVHKGGAKEVERAIAAAAEALARLVAHAVGGARRRHPARGRAARGPVARRR